MSEESTFNLTEWCSKHELDEDTMAVLTKQKLTSEGALKTLSPADCAELELPMGQRNLLRNAVRAMQPQASVMQSESSASSTPQTTQTLARNRELNELVKSLQGSSLKDILKVEVLDQEASGDTEGISKSGPGEKQKPLLIPDFVSKPKCVPDEDEEFSIPTSGPPGSKNAHLFVRSSVKPKVDQVTLPMWVSANARILRELMDSHTEGDNADKVLAKVRSYLDYTARVGDLCQLYTTQSVMVLDDVHRRMQAKDGLAWNDVDLHAQFYHLEKKPLPGKESFRKQRGQRATDSSGREICINYNNAGGCKYTNCRHAHLCMACRASHPLTQHSQSSTQPQDAVPPRFRTQ